MVKIPEYLRRKIAKTHKEKCDDLDAEIAIEERKSKLRKLMNKNVKDKGKDKKSKTREQGLDMMFGGGM